MYGGNVRHPVFVMTLQDNVHLEKSLGVVLTVLEMTKLSDVIIRNPKCGRRGIRVGVELMIVFIIHCLGYKMSKKQGIISQRCHHLLHLINLPFNKSWATNLLLIN